MPRPIRTHILHSGNKELLITSVNLHDKYAIATLPNALSNVFAELAPFAKNKRQIAYIRDFPERTEAAHPGGWSFNDHEMSISLPDWRADRKRIVDTFAEELHHLVRCQNVGYPKTLGDNLVLEATARAYAATVAGVTVPWIRGGVSQQLYDQAKKHWGDQQFDHAAWFYDGPYGKWAGYRLGYRLSQAFFAGGFDLKKSLTAPTKDFKALLKLK